MIQTDAAVLTMQGINKSYRVAAGGRTSAVLCAVAEVDLSIGHGKTYALIGESGAGKTTIGKLALGLEIPDRGQVLFEGVPIRANSRGRRLARTSAVFQDPWDSLDPRFTVSQSVTEPIHAVRDKERRRDSGLQVQEILETVGLAPETSSRRPHQLSGGQRQRVAIARALMSEPSLIVLDEPVSALDVSVKAQIMNLLKEVQRSTGVAYLIISHDLATVRFLSDWVGVMYFGRIVEEGPAQAIFTSPSHPYTQSILDASRFAIGMSGVRLTAVEPPSPLMPPSGCPYHPRCPLATSICEEILPPLAISETLRSVACHHPSREGPAYLVESAERTNSPSLGTFLAKDISK